MYHHYNVLFLSYQGQPCKEGSLYAETHLYVSSKSKLDSINLQTPYQKQTKTETKPMQRHLNQILYSAGEQWFRDMFIKKLLDCMNKTIHKLQSYKV